MRIPPAIKIVSVLLKLTVIVAAAVGILLSAQLAKDTFMGGSRVFMYFTVQSNIAVALLSLIGIFFLLGKPRLSGVWPVLVFVGTVSITLTGAVFTFVLAPTLGRFAWSLPNILTHVVVPAAAIIDFFVTGGFFDVPKKNVFFVVLPPGLYAVYAAIGYAAGWEFSEGVHYPYFFLNWGSPAGAFGFTNELPFMGCVWWILALLVLLIVVGYIYLLAIGGIRKAVRKNTACGE